MRRYNELKRKHGEQTVNVFDMGKYYMLLMEDAEQVGALMNLAVSYDIYERYRTAVFGPDKLDNVINTVIKKMHYKLAIITEL